MNICEGCIKQDVCQFKDVVEKWENSKKGELPHPLVPVTECRYRKTAHTYPCTVTVPCCDGNTTTDYPWSNVTWTPTSN